MKVYTKKKLYYSPKRLSNIIFVTLSNNLCPTSTHNIPFDFIIAYKQNNHKSNIISLYRGTIA